MAECLSDVKICRMPASLISPVASVHSPHSDTCQLARASADAKMKNKGFFPQPCPDFRLSSSWLKPFSFFSILATESPKSHHGCRLSHWGLFRAPILKNVVHRGAGTHATVQAIELSGKHKGSMACSQRPLPAVCPAVTGCSGCTHPRHTDHNLHIQHLTDPGLTISRHQGVSTHFYPVSIILRPQVRFQTDKNRIFFSF